MQLDEEQREAVDAYRESLVPANRAQRNWQTLLRRIEAGETVDLPPLEATREAPHRRSWIGWSVAAAALLLLSGGVSYRVLSIERTLAPSPGQITADASTYDHVDVAPRIRPWMALGRRLAPAPRAQTVLEPAHTLTESFQVAVAGDAVELDRVRADVSTYLPRGAKARQKPNSAISTESRLIGGARAALRDERPLLALRLLDRHARQFPQGVMEEERRALRVAALCLADQPRAAEREAHAFLRDYRDSPLSANVAKHCQRFGTSP